MARNQKLKVFRAAVGFHDVYVAAPSRKAALAAWGSDHDLFARGMAEQVDDPELTREPLQKPGEIVRRLRGTAAEQIASLPKARPKPQGKQKTAAVPKRAPKPAKAKPAKPRPDRTALEEAEQALAAAETRHREERKAFALREAELQRERRKLEEQHRQELARLSSDAEAARKRYSRAMERWNG